MQEGKVPAQTKTQVLHEPVTVLSGVTIGNFAFWADSILVAVLLYYGANSFKRVTEVQCDNQLPYIFQVGISAMLRLKKIHASCPVHWIGLLPCCACHRQHKNMGLLDLSENAGCTVGCIGVIRHGGRAL